jgi:hypothetical protein
MYTAYTVQYSFNIAGLSASAYFSMESEPFGKFFAIRAAILDNISIRIAISRNFVEEITNKCKKYSKYIVICRKYSKINSNLTG